MKKGMFYGVGLGPGDPELVTLKALRVLQGVGRIYAVASRQSDRSVSGAVIAALPGITAELVEPEFTMSTDWGERLARIDAHASAIHAELACGADCAFVSIGDPMTYSTCSYLLRSLRRLDPGLAFEIVPGVNSWSALAAKCGEPLCEDHEILRIVPSYSIAEGKAPELPECSTTVLLKTYRTRNRLLEALPPEARVLYGANLGLDNETYSSRRDEIDALPEAYLSMLAVKK